MLGFCRWFLLCLVGVSTLTACVETEPSSKDLSQPPTSTVAPVTQSPSPPAITSIVTPVNPHGPIANVTTTPTNTPQPTPSPTSVPGEHSAAHTFTDIGAHEHPAADSHTDTRSDPYADIGSHEQSATGPYADTRSDQHSDVGIYQHAGAYAYSDVGAEQHSCAHSHKHTFPDGHPHAGIY